MFSSLEKVKRGEETHTLLTSGTRSLFGGRIGGEGNREGEELGKNCQQLSK